MSTSAKRSAVAKNKPLTAANPGAEIVVLHKAVNIPLDRLRATDRNVRRIKNGVSIQNLADSIARRGLLQSLSVRPVVDASGVETGDYNVQAGGRRHNALLLLVQQGRLATDAAIPCIPKTTGILEDDSLAENTDREALHPLDQFRAMKTLSDQGMPNADIAAAHGVTTAVVAQRLRMAAASPKILDAFGKDRLTLDQVMGFCLTEDHARQEHVLKALGKSVDDYDGDDIRRLIAESTVSTTDPRVRFVGLGAYEKAGGTVLADLFSDEKSVYLDNVPLLTELALKKLESKQKAFIAQGWKWADAAISHPYGRENQFRRLPARPAKDQKKLEQLEAECDALLERDNELTEAEQKRLDKLQASIEALNVRDPVYSKTDMDRAGVLIDIDYDGKLCVVMGLIRTEDLTNEERGLPENDSDAATPSEDKAPDAAVADIPDRVIQDLTSYRTVALRNAVAEHFDVAFQAVLMQFVVECFYRNGIKSALQIRLTLHFPDVAPGLKDMAAAKAIKTRHNAWLKRLPANPLRLWTALSTLDATERADLFAHCAGLTINAVRMPKSREPMAERNAHQIAEAVALDIGAAGFVANVETYFGRVTKAKISDAVREAVGDDKAKLIADLKKGDMAKEAARLIEGTEWLPDILRAVTVPDPTQDTTDEDDARDAQTDFELQDFNEVENDKPDANAALPDYLADEEDEAIATE